MCSFVELSAARRRLWSLLPLAALAVSACSTRNLHPAHSLRFQELQSAQASARGAHEPVARGEEAARAVQLYYSTNLNPSSTQGGSSSPTILPMNSTAGIAPMH